MQPRTSPQDACNDTNAPPCRRAAGKSGSFGAARPASAASIAHRASASRALRSAAVRSTAMVRLSTADRVCAIELFVDDDTGQLVRQRERTQAPRAFGAL